MARYYVQGAQCYARVLFRWTSLPTKTIVDGWLHTGDIGKLVRNKYLKITGRKKQMFKTSYGKYIVPQAIESKFVGSDIIDYLVVIGEGKHCAAAIISPNFPNLRKELMISKTNCQMRNLLRCQRL
jgi:long-chain acyl-CoA synthetase